MEYITTTSFAGRRNGNLYTGNLTVEVDPETNQVICWAELHYKQWGISRAGSVLGEKPAATMSAALIALDECAYQLWGNDMPRGWTVKTRALGEELASRICEVMADAVMGGELPAAYVKGDNLTSALLSLAHLRERKTTV